MVEIENIKSKANIAHIKSPFILKILFSFLTKTQKLKMVAYNKELQKKFLIDIEDYKNISGKYKIGEKNGKGREYIINTKRLIFEGEYLNGKRNGKGKEFNFDGLLRFEGEYFNGKRRGKGKEYDYNDN